MMYLKSVKDILQGYRIGMIMEQGQMLGSMQNM